MIVPLCPDLKRPGWYIQSFPVVPLQWRPKGGMAAVRDDDGTCIIRHFTHGIFVVDSPDGVAELVEFSLPDGHHLVLMLDASVAASTDDPNVTIYAEGA